MSNGSRHALYGVPESTYGETPQDPALDAIRITGTTIGLSKDPLESAEIRSDRQKADFRLGANQVGGDLNFELSYGSFDQLLDAVLMADGWESDTPALGTDQIKAGVTRKSFTFVRHFSDVATADKPYYIYRGVEINSMTLAIAANAMITGTFSVVGKSQALAEDLSVLGTPTFPPASTTSTLDSFTGSLTEGGTDIAVVTEINLELQNGIEPRFVVGSKDTIRPSDGRSNLTGTVTAYFENSTMVEKFLNESDSSIVFELPDGAGNVQRYRIPRIKYTGGQPDVTGEGPVTLSMPFQALLSPNEGTNILIERVPV